MSREKIWLSPPHMGGKEEKYVKEAFRDNWIAPAGPHLKDFEARFAEYVGSKYAVALSSGTAALHLALKEIGLKQGEEVLVSDLTFCASVNPIVYERAVPVLIDSESHSWNMDPNLLEEAINARRAKGAILRAVVLVHLYGQTADLKAIKKICEDNHLVLIEDAAEALGATYHDQSPGTFGDIGIFSFNGNKIITTSGGGMLVTDNEEYATHIRKLSTQARDDAPHYQHSEIGYNYRMSNVLAGIGLGQLEVLDERVAKRRQIFDWYVDRLGELPGIEFMPEADWAVHTRWLTCLTIDPEKFGSTREDARLALAVENVEARPLWKPMHMQPVYREYPIYGGAVSEKLFTDGLCLPSGTAMTESDLDRICQIIIDLYS